MEIIFIDQNKWIELASVEAGVGNARLIRLYEDLISAVNAGLVIFPLTAGLIIETSKRNDPITRLNVAKVQANLSRGCVFCNGSARRALEIERALDIMFGLPPRHIPMHEIIRPGFVNAFASQENLLDSYSSNKISAADLYLHYIMNQDDADRRLAHANFAAESVELIYKLEQGRRLVAGETLDVRQRAYAVRLFMSFGDEIQFALGQLGESFENLVTRDANALQKFFANVPFFDVETRFVTRLELQTRHITPNDIRDMQSFCAAMPYADRIVGEKFFVSLSKQARLCQAYGTICSTDLFSLEQLYGK